MPAAYRPVPRTESRQGPFVVLEGVSGIGKSTLTALLAHRMNATSLHTLADPHTGWSPEANEQLRSLPQFAFYLSGLLHASDLVRQAVTVGPVVADRYASSVAACHAAVHGLDPAEVGVLIDPFRPYLIVPDATFYLTCSEATLRSRMTGKLDIKQDDTDLFDVADRYKQLLENFEQVATSDSTAVILPTDDQSPDQLADTIAAHLEEARA
ncbi:dTMP kinase [Streptomyces inusitatus]|uniref:dTMP kinase n=1 Tax=Streptomyces inusitatus TaxID=68221 RepID=UPI001E2FEF94|nr:thymidylate kinase [Streptomyces inusitatus]